jgi:hypothetical protein
MQNQKESEIHIRVTDKEKKALQRSAKRAGLSLSAYLRMTGLQQKVSCKPSKALRDCCRVVDDLLQTFTKSTARSVEQRLNFLRRQLLAAYHEQEADSGGNDQDLGD